MYMSVSSGTSEGNGERRFPGERRTCRRQGDDHRIVVTRELRQLHPGSWCGPYER